MNNKTCIGRSGERGNTNTWIVILLIVVAVHLVVILGIGGFKLLNGSGESPKGGEIQAPSSDLKPLIKEDPQELPPEAAKSLEQVLSSIDKPKQDFDTEDGVSPVPLPASPGNQSLSSQETAVPATKTAKTAATADNAGNYYIVEEGDTLRKIASKTGVPMDDIRKKNHLEKDIVKIGQKLIIPGKSAEKPSAPAANTKSSPKQPVSATAFSAKQSPSSGNYKTYRVGKGDTLNKIASLFNTSPENLAKINGIDDPRKLKTGMEIKVPKE